MVLVPSPNLSHFQEAGKRRLPAIQVTAIASDRNGFDSSEAVPAGELGVLVATLAYHSRRDLQKVGMLLKESFEFQNSTFFDLFDVTLGQM